MIGTWNFRGLNDPNKQLEVHDLIGKHKLKALGIIETSVRQENQEKVMKGLRLPGWQCLSNYQHADFGRIWIVYNP